LVNCASVEYFTAAQRDALTLRVITPTFLEDGPNGPKVMSLWAKRARGAMARYIIQNRLTDPEALLEFDSGGYRYQPEMSEPDKPVFLRSA
ncbi:MAG: peroxide stress protein YaaA, partial [Maritimibacter sp.]